ncbi:MAG: biotin/lipoyl-containing protein, partial [Phycisphaerae bacterium]
MHTIKLPAKAGSTGATVRRWAVAPGKSVGAGDLLVVLDTQNALVEVTSPVAGVLQSINAQPGTTLTPGEALASVDPSASPQPSAEAETAKPAPQPKPAGAAPVSMNEPTGNVTPLLMPQAGNTMEEGTITQWFVKEGDTIATGDVIYEIETDKATVEVEADEEGKLARIVADSGDIVPVKGPVAYLADNPADVDAYIASQGGTDAVQEKPGIATTSADTGAPPSSAAPVGNVTPLLMPQAGNTMEEG